MTEYTATVVDNFVYIDGGDFSFLNNGTPNYEYCMTANGSSIYLH